MNKKPSDEDLIKNLKEIIKREGRIPKSREITRLSSKYSQSLYARRFGTWNNALEKAGISRGKNIRISETDLLNNLKKLKKKLGRAPRANELRKPLSRYNYISYKKRIGNWEQILEKIGCKKEAKHISDLELIENLKSIEKKIGRIPRGKDIKKPLSKYTRPLYGRRFGSWESALGKAGLDIRIGKNISEEELIKNLIEVRQKLGRIPCAEEVKNPLSKYSFRTYYSIFGSWGKTLERVWGKEILKFMDGRGISVKYKNEIKDKKSDRVLT